MGVFAAAVRDAVIFTVFMFGCPVLLAVIFDGLAWANKRIKNGGKR